MDLEKLAIKLEYYNYYMPMDFTMLVYFDMCNNNIQTSSIRTFALLLSIFLLTINREPIYYWEGFSKYYTTSIFCDIIALLENSKINLTWIWKLFSFLQTQDEEHME